MATRTRQTEDDEDIQRELTANQMTAITAIVAGDSFRDAALKAGVDERTLRRWRTHDAEFEVTLRRAVEDLREDLCMRVTTGAQKALDTVLAIAADSTHPRSFAAACYVLSLARVSAPQNPRLTKDEVFVDQLARFT